MSASLSVGAVVANAARAYPNRVAATIGDEPFTFGQLDAAGTAVASQLITAGLVPGQVAMVASETSFELLAHFVGCARAGVIFAPFQAETDPGTLAAMVDQVEPGVLLCPPSLARLGDALGVPMQWCSVGSSSEPSALPAVTGDDPHIVFFTSGSTGTPKAVRLSHRTSVLRSHPGSQLEPRGPALCPYPLFHMAGWTISMQQWHARSSVVFVDSTAAEVLCRALEHYAIERFNAVPALWVRLAEHLGDDAAGAFPSLRFADTGTSPTSVELLQAIGELAPNASVRVFYGSSEAGNVTSLSNDEVLDRPGSCGLPSVLTEVRLGAGDELLVRGPLLFDAYHGQADVTAEAFTDGWFHTGDIASIDDDGYVSIRGRLGNVIRTGGESVDPSIVEQAIALLPTVEDVAVFGLADPQWGELVVAAVVASSALTIDDVRHHLGADGPAMLSKHHHPRRLLQLDALPRTAATQQVDRGRLRELARNEE